jgi:hypothetical protein
MRIWQWTPDVVEVGAGVGAGAVVGVGAEAEELPQGASLARLLPGNTRLTSCMTATLHQQHVHLWQEAISRVGG